MPPLPHEAVWTCATAAVAARCLHLVAVLGVADSVEDDAVSVDKLAAASGANRDSLDRVLLLLAAHGFFQHTGGGYAHTPASRLLRSDHPMSMRAFVRMMGLPAVWGTLTELEHSLRTGSPAIATSEPRGFWTYLHDRPDEAEIFGQAMTAKAAADVVAVLDAYDFSRFDAIADIGGGRGHLLRAVLDTAPSAQGILFDLPHVIDTLEGNHERLTPRAGDFFVDPLPAADVYVLMEVIHDWTDADAIAILSAIRRAASRGATLLVIEDVIDDEHADPRSRTKDIIMLSVTGGRERTLSQLAELFERARLRLSTAAKTAGPICIVEAVAV